VLNINMWATLKFAWTLKTSARATVPTDLISFVYAVQYFGSRACN
jgi:hypothetical protein